MTRIGVGDTTPRAAPREWADRGAPTTSAFRCCSRAGNRQYVTEAAAVASIGGEKYSEPARRDGKQDLARQTPCHSLH